MLAAREERISNLSGYLVHGDPAQIAFQSSEIAGDLVYLRHGIEVGRGDTVVDAGGNLGAAAIFFATQCGAGTVHSLEPVPATFEALAGNLRAVPGCVAHPFGLAATAGEARVFSYSGGDSVLSGMEAEPERIRNLLAIAGRNLGLDEDQAREMAAGRCDPVEVECRFETLSGFMHRQGLGQVDLLKIDVEGAEADVLKGIEPEDWERIRQVVAEIHSDELLAEVETTLTSRGFRVVTEQSPELAGTPVRLLYATR